MTNRNDSNLSPEESHEQLQGFDDGADDLWAVYGMEVKGYDEEWIKVLKEDMDAILIFVCASFFCSARVDVTLIPGWLILCRSRRIRDPKDSEFEGEPRGPVGLLPEPNRSDT